MIKNLGIDNSSMEIHTWTLNIWKDVHCHQLLGKCTLNYSKISLHNEIDSSNWGKSKKWEPPYHAGGKW